MYDLMTLAKGYLESAEYKLFHVREGFLVAEKPVLGGDVDRKLLWVARPPAKVTSFRELEAGLLEEFETLVPQYPHANCTLLLHTLEGFSRKFRPQAMKLGVRIRVPVQFFDTPFKWEEEPEAASAARSLSSAPPRMRVPQPYFVDEGTGPSTVGGDDIVKYLFEEMCRGTEPCLRIIVGTAGAGKSVMFHSLFARIYHHFQDRKAAQEIFPRPIPLIPEYLRHATALRTDALIDSFLRTEVAANVGRAAFEWMLVNGFCAWFFDGLDELCSQDPDFFEFLLDLLTRSGSKAQFLICARESLLTSSAGFAQLIDEFPPSMRGVIRVYRLKDWEYKSKRAFAWATLEGKVLQDNEPDPPRVREFLDAISRDRSLQELSSLPYYCELLVSEFREGTLGGVDRDYALVERAVSGLIEREMKKGLLSSEQFEPEGLQEWLETIAWEYYSSDFKGLATSEVEEYGYLVLRPDLSQEQRTHALTTLIQFPLFTPGLKPGLVGFKHELMAEYLAGCALLRRILQNPGWVAKTLGARIDLSDSLLIRFMASRLREQTHSITAVKNALRDEALPARSFANLLQLFLLCGSHVVVDWPGDFQLEGRDLRYVRFDGLDLTGVSFRNSDLSNTVFRSCRLENALFEGAFLSGTRFEELRDDALTNARFGSLERFEFVYVGRQRIDSLQGMTKWLLERTGRREEARQACPTARQFRTLFLKFVYPDGQARRDELREEALSRGKRHAGAPNPEDCVRAALHAGFLVDPDWRKRIRRPSGDKYNQVVQFVRNWSLSADMKTLVDTVCPIRSCHHIPSPI
jgi:hypothetical protein